MATYGQVLKALELALSPTEHAKKVFQTPRKGLMGSPIMKNITAFKAVKTRTNRLAKQASLKQTGGKIRAIRKFGQGIINYRKQIGNAGKAFAKGAAPAAAIGAGIIAAGALGGTIHRRLNK